MAVVATSIVVDPAGAARSEHRAARPMRVLFVAGFRGDQRTGAGNAVLSLADALEKRGHSVQTLLAEDFSASVRGGKTARMLFPVAAARRIAQDAVKYDVVVIHEPSAAVYTLARKWNAALPPCVVMSHGVEQRCWDVNGERTHRSLKTRIVHPFTELSQANYSLRHADAVVCLSSEDAEYIHRRLGVPAARVHRMNNGVDVERFRTEWSLSPESKLLFAGSWIPRKGTREFVRSFAELRRSRPGLRATVLGSGLSPDAVRADFAAGDRAAVDVMPSVSRDELPGLLAQDQIFVLPSFFEGMPLTLLEAMAAGLPCVTTNTCGMRDVITDHENGMLVPPGDAAALTPAIAELLDSAALRKRMGGLARESAWRINWDSIAESWETMLAEVSDSRPIRFVLQEGRWSNDLAVDPGERLAGVLIRLSEEIKRSPEGFREMEQWSDLRIAGKILDLGCGTAWKAAFLQRENSNCVVAVDRDSRLLQFGRKHFGVEILVEGDACELAFPSDTFDWVLAVEVVEHLPRPDRFLSEILRVLRPGGKLLLTTPNRLQYLRPWRPQWFYRALRRRIVLEPSHVREFSAAELRRLLPAGLEIERLHHRGTLCGWPMKIPIESVPEPFQGWWAQGIEVLARKDKELGA
ncbi:MAG TPA: glycosyltransferase [Patescibacteria group bacterium]|nr:glycosyltransferase [Patescibacteria group bacterium]